ncbi:mannose-1-phosphate guanylyltransferase [Candidatus Peregrinibacteria bacterium]|nr:mannose-1-phosphate guanylyltransferase [Candidatus Peregrinibacteria bacterium]
MKAVILAGGTGTRLWPMSRDIKPKQFHTFVGNKTMLQQTFERLSFLKPADIFVATNVQYEKLVRQQLKNLPKENLIIEPAMRDTAPGICYAAHYLAQKGFKNEVMAIIYADHLIQKPEEFKRALLFTEKHIKKTNRLGVVAVRAKYPNPNLGYIRIGQTISESREGLEIYELEKFVEKPNIETAKKFLNSYKYLWNTGLYMWKVGTILNKFKQFAPDIYKNTENSSTYEKAQKISIDYAIMEKIASNTVNVIPAELGWNDIGNWAALHEELAFQESENVSIGDHVGIDTAGSVILGESGKLIVTYGIKDMVIVDTPEALLVMPKSKAGEAKKLIEEIKKKKKERFL